MPPTKRSRRAGGNCVPSAASCTPTIASLMIAFNSWVPFSLAQLVVALGEDASVETYTRFATTMTSFSLSTSFTGIGSPETACLNLVEYFVGTITSLAFNSFQLCALYAIEIDTHCQTELREGPHPPRCLFGDICCFLNDAISRKVTRTIHKMTRSQMVQWFPVYPDMFSHIHEGQFGEIHDDTL